MRGYVYGKIDKYVYVAFLWAWLMLGCTFQFMLDTRYIQGEWPSGLYSLRQVTEVKLG